MKKKKVLKIILIIVAVLIIISGFMFYQIWQDTMSSEEISGKRELIPVGIDNTIPVEKGEYDWPNWHGPGFDKKNRQPDIKKNWNGGLEKIWEVNYLCQGERTVSWAAPVVQGNHLIVPGRDENNDIIFCLNAETGELIWKSIYESKTRSNHGPGARATPFIDSNYVYSFGRNGDLVCWNLLDGKLIWKKNVMDEGGEEPTWGHSSSPLVYGNKVYVQGGGKALAIAFNKYSGEVSWKSIEGPAGYAPPALFQYQDMLQILFYHGTGLSALHPDDGKELWSIPWLTDYYVNASLPLAQNDTVFITSGYGVGCQAIKVDADKATPIWKNKTIEGQHTDPVIVEGYIYGYSGMSTRNSGSLKCVRLSDGKEMWSSNKAGNGTLIYVDKHLLCLDLKGNLFLVEANPRKYVQVTEMNRAIRGVKKYAWVTPVIANGKLYLRYMQHLICYQI